MEDAQEDTLENVIKSFEKKYPKGLWKIGLGIVKPKQAKEEGRYESYVCSNLEIGTKKFSSGAALDFTPVDSLKKAIRSMEAKDAV